MTVSDPAVFTSLLCSYSEKHIRVYQVLGMHGDICICMVTMGEHRDKICVFL